MDIELSIIIPAYNEQDRIVPTLANTIEYLKSRPYKSQIVVVSDGSKDDTAQVARKYNTDGHVLLKVIEYHPNRGKGYAVRTGMLAGIGRVIMFMDADYAVPIEYCEKGLSLIGEGFDIAIASRAVKGAQIEKSQNLMRAISAKIYTAVQNLYLGFNYPDTQCGFKLFSKAAAQKLFSQQKLTSVIFDPEILWLARQYDFKVAQFPVQWTHIADSRIQYDSLRKSFFVFQELFRIKMLHKHKTFLK